MTRETEKQLRSQIFFRSACHLELLLLLGLEVLVVVVVGLASVSPDPPHAFRRDGNQSLEKVFLPPKTRDKREAQSAASLSHFPVELLRSCSLPNLVLAEELAVIGIWRWREKSLLSGPTGSH